MTHNAPTIFPALNRPVTNTGNYPFLTAEISKLSHDVNQAAKIAESIEQGNEDIFRDFDLSTFMEHFKLDALEKTILALAFKFGSRSDLKTKGTCFILIDTQQRQKWQQQRGQTRKTPSHRPNEIHTVY